MKILDEYQVNEYGTIQNLGKFEGDKMKLTEYFSSKTNKELRAEAGRG